MGFCMGFCILLTSPGKNPLSLAEQRVSLELLTRFELVTSSLPDSEHMFWFVVTYRYLLQKFCRAELFRKLFDVV